MDGEKILELLRNCREGDTIVWDEPNGEVYKIKLEKKYPKGWKPEEVQEGLMGSERVEEEMVLNLENQYEPCMENLNLMIDFLYGGSFVEVLWDLYTLKEQKKIR